MPVILLHPISVIVSIVIIMTAGSYGAWKFEYENPDASEQQDEMPDESGTAIPERPSENASRGDAGPSAPAEESDSKKRYQVREQLPETSLLPGAILDLRPWKLTLPIRDGGTGSPLEVKQPSLTAYTHSQFFHSSPEHTGVVFRAHAGGYTTENSSYPRSELREMTADGTNRASWSNNSGTHTMVIRQAITEVPSEKPHVVAGQIHDGDDDVIQIRLEGAHLFVESDGDLLGTLNSKYRLGTPFTVKITAHHGRIEVYYGGVRKVNYKRSGSGYYFKAGCYTQSNTGKGDKADAYGEVVIYDLSVSHN